MSHQKESAASAVQEQDFFFVVQTVLQLLVGIHE